MTNSIGIAAGLSAAFGASGLTLSGQTGTIAAVAAHGANTVDVYLDNSAGGAGAAATPGLPYASDYNPAVGDAVFIISGQAALQTSRFVLCTMAGSSSGPGSSGVPVGTILMFPVVVTYPNWLLCNGATFSAVTYPLLNTLLGGTTLPNLINTLPMGAGSIVSLGNTAGAQTANTLIAHTHGGPSHTHSEGSHTHSGPSHTHTHNHGTASGANFLVGSGTSADITIGGGQYGTNSLTDTDSTAGGTGPTGAGAGGGTGSASGTTGSAGSGSSFSVLNPVLGVAYFIRAA